MMPFEEFAKSYLAHISTLLNQIDTVAIAEFVNELESACQNQNTIFFVGNGGSASTASHMSYDFSTGIYSTKGGKMLRTLSLTDNVSTITAIANDFGYENVFAYQLKLHFHPGDKLVAISASGNSLNVLKAAKWMKEQGGRVIGIVGFDGGKLSDICDILIHIKTQAGDYGSVEAIHMILSHMISKWLNA